jgi:hypothetical protein
MKVGGLVRDIRQRRPNLVPGVLLIAFDKMPTDVRCAQCDKGKLKEKDGFFYRGFRNKPFVFVACPPACAFLCFGHVLHPRW